jgi:uncharacterized membrane protein HdeD (DUF308 family)
MLCPEITDRYFRDCLLCASPAAKEMAVGERKNIGEGNSMNWALVIAILTLVAGIVVLVWPKILNYIVAAFLIVTGILGIIANI